MKLAILGYGVEGQSVERYFKTHPYDNVPPEDIEITIFKEFDSSKMDQLGLDKFDVIFRSPSVRPNYDFKKHDDTSGEPTFHKYEQDKGPYWTSATDYFLRHCPTEDIITVTGTKGKGTTCSMIKALVEELPFTHQVFLVGNIGVPPLDVLDEITDLDTVVFEISSFQLWDLHLGTFASVIVRIEPDHLNVHKDFDEYLYAKSAVARYKAKNDCLVYYKDNKNTASIAGKSRAQKFAYPIDRESLLPKAKDNLEKILNSLSIPGAHNRENAEAAILGATLYRTRDLNIALTDSTFVDAYIRAFEKFQGLPHRCQFLRELNNVKYYDDNYSSALPALDVALKAFENYPTVLIAGGISKGTDAQVKQRIFSSKNLIKAILIGSTAKFLAEGEDTSKYELADSLKDAVTKARTAAEKVAKKGSPAVVLMSPGFASFDMFKNFSDRGEQYTKLIKGLK